MHEKSAPVIKDVVKIGLLDSGVSTAQQARTQNSCSFLMSEQGEIIREVASDDAIEHGSAIADILLNAAPAAVLLNAQIFSRSNTTSPALVASGLNWLSEQQADIVNMSFGLRQNRAVLREACEQALAAGMILVASAPARGPAVFPSAYPGVIRVTGDARCDLNEFSHLATQQADFGACPRSYARPKPGSPSGGASFAVPHVVGVLARYLAEGGDPAQSVDYLKQIAIYHGPERRVKEQRS